MTILFYFCAAVAIAGALLATLTDRGPVRALRLLGLLGVALGTAAMFALLSAGLAALVELLAGAAAAVLIAQAPPTELVRARAGWPAQLAAAAAALLFALLAFAAWRGGLVSAAYPGGGFNAAALGRLLLDRDALAGVALGGMLLTAVAGAAATWRVRRR